MAKDPTPTQVAQKVKDWWAPIGLVASLAVGGTVAWYSKASASDLDAVKSLLTEQDKKTERLEAKLNSLDRLFADVLQLRARIEVIGDRLTAPPPSPPPTTIPSAAPTPGQAQGPTL